MEKLFTQSILCSFVLLFSGYFLHGATLSNRLANTLTTPHIQNYGHRGCRGLEPENSLPAYKKALEIGVDFVDMDINMTKDGVLVVTHNTSLNPDYTKDASGSWISTKNKLYIQDLTLAQIQKYDIGEAKPGTKYSALFPNQETVPGTKISTLKEVIDYVKANATYPVQFQIEMKSMPLGIAHYTESKKMAEALYNVLKKENIIDITEVQDFDWTALHHLSSLDKNIKTAYLLIPPPRDWLTKDNKTYNNATGLTSESDINLLEQANDKTLGIAKMDSSLSATGKTDLSLFGIEAKAVKALGGFAIEPIFYATTQNMVDTAHKNHLKIVSWCSPGRLSDGKDFHPPVIEKLIGYHVDGLITDRPDLLKEMLYPQQMI